MPDEYTQKQLNALRSDEGGLVAAAAGSGKTRVLTGRVVRLIEQGADIREMMIATFTNSAAAEMRSRIAQALTAKGSSARMRRQAEYVGTAHIGTFHNFCGRVIKENFDLLDISYDFRTATATEAALLKQQTAEELLSEYLDQKNEDFLHFFNRFANRGKKTEIVNILLATYEFIRKDPDPWEWVEASVHRSYEQYAQITGDSERARREYEVTQPDVVMISQLLRAFDEKYTEKKREKTVLDFDDLLHYGYAVLKQRPCRFSHVFVDEYQDTNPLQAAIVAQIARKDNLFLVGDIKQSIYRFNFADPEIFLNEVEKRRSGEGAPLFVMNENFRSSQAVVDTVNTLMTRVMTREFGGVDYDDNERLICKSGNTGQAAVLLCEKKALQDEQYYAEGCMIARKIRSLLGSEVFCGGRKKVLDYGDFCVLSRTGKSNVDALRRAFDHYGIPYAQSREAETQSRAAELYVCILQLVENDRHDLALLTLMRYPLCAFANEEIARIRLLDKKRGGFAHAAHQYAEEKQDALSEKLRGLFDKIRELKEVFSAYSLRDFLDAAAESFRLNDYAQLLSDDEYAALQALIEEILGFDQRSLYLILKQLADLKRRNGGAYVKKKLTTAGGVLISTIHFAKGLEYPVVFVANLQRKFMLRSYQLHEKVMRSRKFGMMPMYIHEQENVRKTTLLREKAAQEGKEQDRAEELRLLYVAMTRAQNSLYLTACFPDLAKLTERAGQLAQTGVADAQCLYDFVLLANQDKSVAVEAEGEDEQRCDAQDVRVCPPSAQEEQREYRFFSLEKRTPVPAKTAVSALERDTGFYLRPVRLEDEEITGAKLGSLVHIVLENLPELQLNARQTAAHLFERKILTQAEKEAVEQHADLIDRFFETDLAKRIQASERVLRETPFNILMPAELLELGHTGQVMVQGVLDLAFLEDRHWVIVDYKTDRTDEAGIPKLKKRYAKQLSLYAYALEKITKIPVREGYLCFLRPGCVEKTELKNYAQQ